MEATNTNPIYLPGTNQMSSVLKVYFMTNHLKQLYRQGWLQFIPKDKIESVADHVLSMAIIALFMNAEYALGFDDSKILIMIILHDISESFTPDFTPDDHVSREEQYRQEKEAIEKILEPLTEKKDTFFAIWDEFEMNTSPAAHFVDHIDTLERLLQASIYEKQYDISLQEFFDNGSKLIHDDLFKQLLKDIEAFRTEKNSKKAVVLVSTH